MARRRRGSFRTFAGERLGCDIPVPGESQALTYPAITGQNRHSLRLAASELPLEQLRMVEAEGLHEGEDFHVGKFAAIRHRREIGERLLHHRHVFVL